jgi:predicted GNAT superfamily acetyltransferase
VNPVVASERYAVRSLDSLPELEACFRLQEEVWGRGFREAAAVSILKVSQRLGGVVGDALDESGQLVGFVFGLTGMEDGRPVHWSHMLAVRPGLRDGGLGRRLKAWQRDRCRALGVRRMYWTFDPLVARNG